MLTKKVINYEVMNQKAEKIRQLFQDNYEELVYMMQIKNNKIVLDVSSTWGFES